MSAACEAPDGANKKALVEALVCLLPDGPWETHFIFCIFLPEYTGYFVLFFGPFLALQRHMYWFIRGHRELLDGRLCRPDSEQWP